MKGIAFTGSERAGEALASRAGKNLKKSNDGARRIERVGYDRVRTFLYAIAYHALDRKKESDAALKELIAKYQAIDPYLIAAIYAFRKQSDEAFEWLDRAYAQRDDDLIVTKVDPLLKSLHNDRDLPRC